MKLKNLILPALVLAIGVLTINPAVADTYTLDAAHSSVGFQIKHLAIAKVNGSFADFTGSFTYEKGKPETWSVEADIQVKSVNTGNNDRDDHLRNADFFDVEQYPVMTFKSTGVKMKNDSEGVLMGNLTLHGVTHAVELDLEFNGAVTDPWGNDKVGFSASGKINRKNWGLNFNKALETGGLMLGEDVKISLEIEAAKNK
jgi:polyisoprenoid-binding protein YceI